MLTDWGRKVADHEISQTEFSAVTIMTHQLPNTRIQPPEVCQKWQDSGISIKPLKLILSLITSEIFDNCFKKGGYCSKKDNSHFGGQEYDYEISGGESKFAIDDIEVYEILFQ